MSEIITRTVVELEQLGVYHELNKAYIDAGLEKKWESATFDETTRKVSFYTVPQPSGDVKPVFTFTLPEVDFTEIYNMIDALEEKVDKNAEDIAGLRTDVDAINNAETGILKQAKDYTDEKVTALANGAVKENTDAIAKLNGDAETEGSVAKAIADAKADTDADIEAINEKIGEVAEDKTVAQMIADNADAIAAEIERATKAETDNKALIDANAEAINTEKERAEAAEKANADTISALTDKIGEVTEGKTVADMIAENTQAIEAHKTAVDEKVTTLVGEDAGKSVRTIANEELAAQLLSGDAEADFKTLQELAAWLEDHPESVAEINANIANLQKLIGALPEDATATDVIGYIQEVTGVEKTRAEAAEAGLDERLQAVEEAIGENGSVATQIDAKIAELDADVTSAEVEEGKGVQVQVVEVGGKVTTVAVTGNYDNTYDAKGDAAQALTDAKAYADEKDAAMDARVDVVESAIGEGGSVTTAIADAQADADEALSQLAAIQYATEEDIRGLWA